MFHLFAAAKSFKQVMTLRAVRGKCTLSLVRSNEDEEGGPLPMFVPYLEPVAARGLQSQRLRTHSPFNISPGRTEHLQCT